MPSVDNGPYCNCCVVLSYCIGLLLLLLDCLGATHREVKDGQMIKVWRFYWFAVYLFVNEKKRYLSSCYAACMLGLKPKMTLDQHVTAVCDEKTSKLVLDGGMVHMTDPDSEGWMGGIPLKSSWPHPNFCTILHGQKYTYTYTIQRNLLTTVYFLSSLIFIMIK